jgi:hypothetical protein
MQGPTMPNLPPDLLHLACRVFLQFAYPDGKVPENRQAFSRLLSHEELDSLIEGPLCELIPGLEVGQYRGYAFRLGCRTFPHVKLQAIWHNEGNCWVFAVDTHDAIPLPGYHPEFKQLQALKAANLKLKQQIEQAWEHEGLQTFCSILRHALVCDRSNP